MTSSSSRTPSSINSTSSAWQWRSGHESGSVLVELAIAIPFLLLLLSAVFRFHSSFYSRNVMLYAAREGARSAARFDAAAAAEDEVETQLLLRSFNASVQYIVTAGLNPELFDISIRSRQAYHLNQDQSSSQLSVSIRQKDSGWLLPRNCVSSSFMIDGRVVIPDFNAASDFECEEV